MKINDYIHTLKIDFKIPLPDGRSLDRFTWVYLLVGERLTLIDTGVAGCWPKIAEYVRSIGRTPDEIDLCVFTHSHPDHIGSARSVFKEAGCAFAAGAQEKAWIEDPALQKSVRPVPGFDSLVEGGVSVGMDLTDGETIKLDGCPSPRVILTPGHSAGHAALHFEEDGIIITGDSVLPFGDMPIYDDYALTKTSLGILCDIPWKNILLSALAKEPIVGDAINPAIASSLEWLEKIDNAVKKYKSNSLPPTELAKAVVTELALPPLCANPITARAFASHLISPAYLLVEVEEVTDQNTYSEYLRQVPDTIKKHSGRYLARGVAEPLAGGWKPGKMVLIEFPSKEHIYRWWESPEYKKLAPLRESCAKSKAVILELK